MRTREIGPPSDSLDSELAAALDAELLAALRPGVDGIFDLPPIPGGGLASTIVEPLGERRLILRREGALSADALARAGFQAIRP